MEDRIILGIDNSLDFLNIVIASDNRIIEERRIGNMRIPSGVIGTEVSEMLSSNNFTFENVRAIIVTLGPGSFTGIRAVSYTHLRAHETVLDLVCRLLLEKQK